MNIKLNELQYGFSPNPKILRGGPMSFLRLFNTELCSCGRLKARSKTMCIICTAPQVAESRRQANVIEAIKEETREIKAFSKREASLKAKLN